MFQNNNINTIKHDTIKNDTIKHDLTLNLDKVDKNHKIQKKKLTQKEVDLFVYAMEYGRGIISPVPSGFIKTKINGVKSIKKFNEECKEARRLINGIYRTGILNKDFEPYKIHISFPVQYLFRKLGREEFLRKYVEVVGEL